RAADLARDHEMAFGVDVQGDVDAEKPTGRAPVRGMRPGIVEKAAVQDDVPAPPGPTSEPERRVADARAGEHRDARAELDAAREAVIVDHGIREAELHGRPERLARDRPRSIVLEIARERRVDVELDVVAKSEVELEIGED